MTLRCPPYPVADPNVEEEEGKHEIIKRQKENYHIKLEKLKEERLKEKESKYFFL